MSNDIPLTETFVEQAKLVSEPRSEIKEVIRRAITAPVFKELLLRDPDKALEDFTLTEVQRLLIKSLNEEDLNKLTPENLEEYFSADAAVYTPDETEPAQAYEMYSVDELEDNP